MFNIPRPLPSREDINHGDETELVNLDEAGAQASTCGSSALSVVDVTGNNRLWTTKMTLHLIDLIGESIEEFENSVKKTVWFKTAKNYSNHFTKQVSPQQVESKWKALKRTYKSILLHNKSTGKQRGRWEFFDAIHNFMYKMPEIQPPATCSSSFDCKV